MTTEKHIIDCDASPFVPDDWSIYEHRPGGKLEWHEELVYLYLSSVQEKGSTRCYNLLPEFVNKPVLNACVLDYLIIHPHLIPNDWKGKMVFFWGTIYDNGYGRFCVRYLYWQNGKWNLGSRWISHDWSYFSRAACLKDIPLAA